LGQNIVRLDNDVKNPCSLFLALLTSLRNEGGDVISGGVARKESHEQTTMRRKD